MGQLLLPQLRPLFLLFNSLSVMKEMPGSVLEERLQMLETGLVNAHSTARQGNGGVWFNVPESGGEADLG